MFDREEIDGMSEYAGGMSDLSGAMPILRRLRCAQGLQQKMVARSAEIEIGRFRKLEEEVGRYLLRRDEGERWAAALGTALDEVLLEAVGFHDLLPKGLGYSLVTYAGRTAGVEFVLATAPRRGSGSLDFDEAAVWEAMPLAVDLSTFDEIHVRPASRSEAAGWVAFARANLLEGGYSLEDLCGVCLYADAVREEV